jgi:circadian clock protein KaiB
MSKPDEELPGRSVWPSVESEQVHYVLRLFVTGMTPRSTDAIARIKAICEEHLNGQYELEVVDIYQQPDVAKGEQIVATPTLIKKLPAPLRRLVGDLSDKQRVLLGLNITAK